MGRREGSRIKWTEEMNDALLQCKSKAVKLAKGDNPPRSENGRKIGYMSLMTDMWDELGYGHLALSSQNLRDKAAALDGGECIKKYCEECRKSGRNKIRERKRGKR